MEEPQAFYPQLNPAQKQKVNALMNALFKHNASITHPFLDELHSLKQEEYSQMIISGGHRSHV